MHAILNKSKLFGPGPQNSDPGYDEHLTKDLDVEANLNLNCIWHKK